MSAKPRQMTNVQLVKHFMEFSRAGAMSQCFLVEALNRYTTQVLKDEAETRKQMANGFIHPDAWIAGAKDGKEMAEKNYGWKL